MDPVQEMILRLMEGNVQRGPGGPDVQQRLQDYMTPGGGGAMPPPVGMGTGMTDQMQPQSPDDLIAQLLQQQR